ncbi:hypothetical protein POSPLADRAFT_1066163 [Postia placenta MAD-698-R-SB12]|uniref:UBC core domain-containing protein n=1 Tax=Postia placenta MAD-698-R-SB12 TaxID=670580 RepID=A0A1X6N1F6_9APHY|nr:hypothetical protein POSPLADRAFT_1066163 [Postia placenta MAD-698-R-SB12]OSX62461.1 hypothetical protein POSPLADRAFT_1066163 [Postia placenta MAD-698-R-SB12]
MPPALSTSTTLKRIHREIADLKKEDLGAITLAPAGDNLFHWTATLPGPEGSCYEGGVFQIEIHLAPDYPFSAPKVTFRTRIYHVNINDRGNICIDILKHNWSPALSLFKVILSLSSLLTDPNPKDPLVPSIATQYLRNRSQYDHTARQWTELYARPPPPAAASPSAAKGKGRAADIAPTPAAAARRPASSAGTTQTQAISIDDSEDEGARGAARTRAATKRKRGQADPGDVLVIDDEAPERPTRRRRGGGASKESAASRLTRADSDVIVIED